MKSINTRLLGLFVIVLMSVGSYIFLQSVAVPEKGAAEGNAIELHLQQTLQEEAEAEESNQTALPEVQLLKFVIETGKRFLPAS
ncbi:MAG: hypothetical protein KTR30_19870 [Saprospiraceae bacterium]|nr:hypothetical protein [Saprospiraceae bacterium]